MNTQTITRESRVEATYARLSEALDAEAQALLWCAAANGATEEVKTAREAHLMTVRVELAQAKLEWAGITA